MQEKMQNICPWEGHLPGAFDLRNWGRAFDHLFSPVGREFEQAKLKKFKCPGGGGDVELSN